MNALLSQGKITGEWTGGFWKDRWETCRDRMVPHMWSIYQNAEIAPAWNNFRIAIGETEGKHKGPPFWDGDVYKWLEGAIRVNAGSDDEKWNAELDRVIETITKVQRDDGYIFTLDAIERRNNGSYDELGDDLNFEVYNMGHLMSAGVMHYNVTGKTNLLELGQKAAVYIAKQFSNLDKATPRTAICPSHYMGLAELYKITGDESYIDLLEKLILMRDMVPEGNDDNQDRTPTKEQREIVGHGVRATYLYAGLTDLYMGKGDEDYRTVLEAVWNDMVTRKMYITGGCAPLYDGISPYGVANRALTQTTHQSFGRAFELPNVAGYNETCATVGSYLWNFRMAQAFGSGKYGDEMERAIYNTILSGIDLDGDAYFYTNPLRCVHDHPHTLKWGAHREDFIESFCCPPNVVRSLAGTPDKQAFLMDGGPAFLLYGHGNLNFDRPDGAKIACEVASNYPWHGEISITISAADVEGAFPVFMRIPGWAAGFTLSINDRPVANAKVVDGYVRLDREWQSGDKIHLSLPMETTLVESHPLIEENRNHLAVQRGPLVYCLESVDLPDEASLANMHLSPNSQFTFQMQDIAGVELGVLKGALWLAESSKWESSDLYRRRDEVKFKKIDAMLVPYFAWDNRGNGEMTVWMPVRPEA